MPNDPELADELHKLAMWAAAEADAYSAVSGDNVAKMAALRYAAYRCEERAANMLYMSEPCPRPSCAVMHRSAAWLALQCGETRAALRLADHGLDGKGLPLEIKAELRKVNDAAWAALGHPAGGLKDKEA